MNMESGRYAVRAIRLRRRVMAAVAAAAVPLAAAGTAATPASAAGAVAGGPGLSVPAAVPGTRLWVRRYNGPADGADTPVSVAVSPGGATVFVTGTSPGSGSGGDYLTVAYSAATGARLWDRRYNGPANGADTSGSVAVSPDGATIFVTGTSTGTGRFGEHDYATVAYRASDGKQLWASRYSAPAEGSNSARAVSVARDGTAVFVTGTSYDGLGYGYLTVAYSAATGAQLWVSRYAGSRAREASAAAVASPGGNRVFVTGYSRWEPPRGEASYVTVAYNAATGAQLWIRRYHGTALLFDAATALAASAGGGTVVVTGHSSNQDTGGDYATVAYRASDGKQLWVRRYNGPSGGRDGANAVAVSGGTVSVTGTSQGATSGDDYATVAYNAATGAQLWVRRYNGPGNGADSASSLASPGNGVVYVTGTSWGGKATRHDYATIAYTIRTGALLWARRYNGPVSSGDYARSLAAAGGRVFVTGSSYGAASGLDYATIAYTG